MAEHKVQICQLPNVEIVNTDLVIAVDADGVRFGTLTISRGGLGWWPENGKKERPISWEEFDRMVRERKG